MDLYLTLPADMHYPTGATLGFLNSVQNVGAVLVLPLVPLLIDAAGRRHALAAGATVTLVAGVLQGTSYSVPQFIVARFLIGVGLAFTIVASPLLLVELALPKHRGAIMGLFPTVYYIGSISAAWVVYGTESINNSWAWRIPSLLQVAPALVQIPLLYLVPESPRWLISKGKSAEARAILTKYHANGREDDPIVALEYGEIDLAIQADRRHKIQGSWKDLINSPANRRRTLIVFFCSLFIEVRGLLELIEDLLPMTWPCADQWYWTGHGLHSLDLKQHRHQKCSQANGVQRVHQYL